MKKIAGVTVAVVMLLLGGVLFVGGAGSSNSAAASTCGGGGAAVVANMGKLPKSVGAYKGEQVVNAAIVINVGQQKSLSKRAQTIAVMAAIGESSLTNPSHGDAARNDTIGMFQIGPEHGAYADRMDPAWAAGNFYKRLVAVPGWETMEPTLAAHKAQRNADPYHYARFWDDAVMLVDALSAAASGPAPTPSPGTTPTSPGIVNAGAGDLGADSSCVTGQAGTIQAGKGGWVLPSDAVITSGYGSRGSCGGVCSRFHQGLDFGGACGSPIRAAAAGRVIYAGAMSGYGNAIDIDHGGGITTRYGHMYDAGVLARVGQTVAPGTVIGAIGSNGNSTGCHLHFEVAQGGQRLNPEPWLVSKGLTLRRG